MGFFKQQKKEQAYLALDIGSEAVKAMVFNLERSRVNILGYGKHYHSQHAINEGVIKDLSQVIENCELAIAQASLQAGIRPGEAIIGVCGEQVKGFTAIVQFERSKPKVKISEKEMNNIIKKVQEAAHKRSLKKFRQEIGRDDLEIKLVNAALTHIMIDGERVDDPIGFRGIKMQVGVFNAYAPLVQLSNLQRIASHLGLEIMALAAEPYTLAEAIIPDEDLTFEALIIDIGGSTTDVIVVQHQDVAAAKMFSLGGQAVTKEIEEAFGIPYEEAEELKAKYCNQEIQDKEQIDKIKNAVARALTLWQTGIEVVLKDLGELKYLPRKILLTGGGSLLPEILATISEVVKRKDFPFPKEPIIRIINPQYFDHVADRSG